MATEIHGYCDPRFAPLEDAFRANFDEGLELGASLAVTLHGKPVVDLWAGCADRKGTVPWRRDTIALIYSTTKIAPVLMTLMLVDRGQLELDSPIARYWPAFAQGGKEHVTIRDALTHQAGVPGFAEPLPFEAMRNWKLVTERIAAERHWFEGERTFFYHPITYGFILGELIRIVSGVQPSVFFRQHVAGPLGADFQIGLKNDADQARAAELQYPLDEEEDDPDSLVGRAFASFGTGRWDTWHQRLADIPASNGYGNGRSIARIGAIFACRGELEGIRFLSAELVDEARKEQLFAPDSPLGPVSLGLGFGLHSEAFPAPTPSCFHWGGYGGSFVVMDVETGVSCGYAMNRLTTETSPISGPRHERLWPALGEVMRLLPQPVQRRG